MSNAFQTKASFISTVHTVKVEINYGGATGQKLELQQIQLLFTNLKRSLIKIKLLCISEDTVSIQY